MQQTPVCLPEMIDMKKIELYEGADTILSPRVADVSIYPDIDDSYTAVSYNGERLSVRTSQVSGIKLYGSMVANRQGLAIFGNIAVRMANESTSTTHYVYSLENGNITEVATFLLSGTLHSNALQFAPVLEDGQTLPYLYVAGLDGKCFVLEFDSSYQATIVQTITISGGNQLLIGDDGFMWSSAPGDDNHRRFRKYRKVAVSEGDVTLTDSDLLDDWQTLEQYPSSTYTAQGWKVKMGKIWFSYGASGNGQNRGIAVYDTATHRHIATLDFSSFSTLEWEDIDFYNDGILAAMYTGQVYEIKV